MVVEQARIVHLVDVISGEQQHVFAAVAAQHVQVLEHRVGGAAVPAFLIELLLRGQDVDVLADAAVEKAPAALQVADQTLRLILRGDADAAHAGIHAVGEREIDDAIFAAKRNRRLAAPVGQLLQTGAASAGEHHRIGAARKAPAVPARDLRVDRAGNRFGYAHDPFSTQSCAHSKAMSRKSVISQSWPFFRAG